MANDMLDLPTSTLIDLWERAGYVFESSSESLVGGGDNYDLIFTTGSRPVVLFGESVSYNGEGFNILIYRDPVYTGGTPVVEINNPNDVNPANNTCGIIGGATISNAGTLTRAPKYVFGNPTNQGQGGTLEVVQSPQIILPNKELLIRIVNRDSANQDIASHLRWAEPPYIQDYTINDAGEFVSYKGII